MKLSIILVVCLIASTMAVVPACLAASYCKAWSITTANNCDRCHNWKLGTIGATYVSANACLNGVAALAGCKIYNPNTITAANGAGSCRQCNSSKPIVELTAGGDTSVVCAATLPTGCPPIANCEPQICASSDASPTYTATCLHCSSGKGVSAANACAATIMTNCETSWWAGTAQVCGYPKSGYAVERISLVLHAYATDSDFQQLATRSTTQCQTCWDGYYWNTTVWKLSAKLLGSAFLVVVGFFVK